MIITIAPVIGHVDTLLEAMQDCLGSQHPPSGLTFQADRHVCLLQKNVIDCCGSLICDFFLRLLMLCVAMPSILTEGQHKITVLQQLYAAEQAVQMLIRSNLQ